jgi:hypothetical protein
MNFFSGGRTAELAVLAVEGRRSYSGGQEEPFTASWMLHVPSGKLIEFDELFVDPATVRKRISEVYRRNIPSRMGGRVTFLGDDAGKKEAIYRDTYRRAAYRLSTPARNHFRDVRFNSDGAHPGLLVYFSEEILPGDDTAYGGASLKFLRPHLRREYIRAFDPAGAPQPATVKGIGGN